MDEPWSMVAELQKLIDELAALKEENRRMRQGLDDIYNHNEAARAAVILHYGLHHSTPEDAGE